MGINFVGLDYVLQSNACRGAFKVEGAALTPLSAVEASVEKGAYRTRNLWASLVPVVSDAGIMVGSRGAEQSIASTRGGVIVEARTAFNLGMLKAALTKQDPVTPHIGEDLAADLSPGQSALLNLAEWIAAIEVPRCMRVHLGSETLELVAAKGHFRPIGAHTSSGVSEQILDAANNECPIEISYAELPEDIGSCDLSPFALFGTTSNTAGEWRLGANGAPISVPETATLTAMRDIVVLGQRLADWRQGLPFELAVLREGKTKEIIATSDASDEMSIKTPVL